MDFFITDPNRIKKKEPYGKKMRRRLMEQGYICKQHKLTEKGLKYVEEIKCR